MLELTVKTLDSQNHSFTLPDEATVLNLKESILEKMEVPIATQRLIFHGKVLHDQKKLTEYGDVNGKVIHLVQRAPPSSSRPSDNSGNRAEAGGGGGRASRRPMNSGNTTYLGSMAFPAEFVDGQAGLEISTRPSQAMARNRIDCAKRMMGYARQSMRHIEDPQTEQPPPTGARRRWTRGHYRPFNSEGRRDAAPTADRGTSTASTSSTPVPPAATTTSAASSASASESAEPVWMANTASSDQEPVLPEMPMGFTRAELLAAGFTSANSTSSVPEPAGLTVDECLAVVAASASASSAPEPAESARSELLDSLTHANYLAPGVLLQPCPSGVPGTSTVESGVNDSSGTHSFVTDEDVAVEVEIESSDALLDGRSEAEQAVGDNSAEPPPAATAPTANRALRLTRREEGARVENMVPLLQDLENLHNQLTPYLGRCRELLSADTAFEENATAARDESSRIFNGMSETLHSLAHACHALSDLMVDFDEDPPRSLRCRPVVLQHSTILETGFPIRFNPQDFEAQINVRRVDVSTGTETSTGVTTTGTSTPTTSTTSASGRTTTSSTGNVPPSPVRNGSGLYVGIGPGNMRSFTDGGRFGIFGDDNIAGNVEVLMDFGEGMHLNSSSPLPPFNAPPATNDSNSTAPPNAAPPAVNISMAGPFSLNGGNFSPFGQGPDLRAYVALPAAGPFNLLQSVQAIAGQIHSQLMNRNRPQGGSPAGTPTGAAADQSPPTSSASSESQSASSDASAPPGVQTPPQSSNVVGAGRPSPQGADSTASPRPAPQVAEATDNTPPPASRPERRVHFAPDPPRAFQVPVGDMFQTLFQATFDPTLPCNSHHIRTTRQRASQTPPRVRVRELGGGVVTPGYQVLTHHGMPSVGRRRRVNVVVPQERGAGHADAGAAAQPMEELIPRWLSRLLEGVVPLSGTIADFLNIVTEAPHVDGQSVVTDLLMTLARNLTWIDVLEMSVSQGNVVEDIMNRLRPVLQEFVLRCLLQGEPASTDAINRACERLYDEMRPFIDAMELVRLRESVDLSATINNYNQSRLPDMISLIIDPAVGSNFGASFTRGLTSYMRQLVAIVMHCCVDGGQGFDVIVRNCVRLLTRGVPEDIQQWTEFHSINNLHQYTSRLNIPLEDIQRFLVYRIPSTPATDAASAPQEPMETDSAMGSPEWVPPETIPSPEKVEEPIAEALVAMDTDNLPDVVIGSESWHTALPSEWVPVIARDTQRQRKQASQKPFSDAYLSGMPPKRRKIIASNKPQGDSVAQNISEGLRQAIHSAGITSPTAERAVTDAGRDPVLQQAYKQQEKAAGSQVLRADPDYKPSRFPSAHKYFDK